MPTRHLKRLSVITCLTLAVWPSIASAGDRPIVMVGDWGIGEIDGQIMFYTGHDSFVFTDIPAPPRGPLHDLAYNVYPFVVGAGVAFWLYRRRRMRDQGLTCEDRTR